MDRTIDLYNSANNRKFPPALVIYGKDAEIDSTILDLGLKGIYGKYISTKFARKGEVYKGNIPSPYGSFDVYIRILDRTVNDSDVIMVITAAATNMQNMSSLQRIVEDLTSQKETEGLGVQVLNMPFIKSA